ncbi:MAG: ABC-2 family transporter protein [Anaerolineales bacterium]|nr:ABC-2 family transporter protein [Anaerolineales bacterium]
MQLFWEICKRSFQRHLTYRAATLAGLVTNFFFGLMRVAIMLALYGGRQEVNGMTVADVITYTGLTQAIIAYMSMFGWYELMNSVYSGEVAADLLKPMNYFLFWMAQDLGRALLNFLLRGVTIMFFYALVFDLSYPTSLSHWLVVALVLILSWVVGFAYRFLVNLSAFWTTNADGIGRFAFVFAWFASGFLMPMRLLPDWVGRLCYLTPFPYMLDSIVEVYLGTLSNREVVLMIANQLVWAIGLIVVGQIALRAAVRRLVILGG